VPFAPAGGTDILARALAQRLTESMGQTVLVDNRPGANSIIGTDVVAKAAPDGHTLLFTTQVLTINPSLHASMPYQAERDFAPVTIAASAPNLLAIHPSIPVRSVKQLIALARSKPGSLTIAAAGTGTPSHLGVELFRQMGQVDLLVVQYKGGGNSLNDVAGGQVATTFGTLPSLTPLAQSGRLRALALSGAKRSAVLPGVPTISETLPGFECETWYAVLVPAKTPAEIVTRLHGEIVKALAHPDVKQRLSAQGFEAGGMRPEEMARVIRMETQRWAKVIRDGNIRAE
jgi:tripartite-type tricarboxylate transporter receptor subunit TctC